jgi:hypothetical protein
MRVFLLSITASDFERSGAAQDDLEAVLSEMLDNISGYRAVALLAEVSPDQTKLLLALHPSLDFSPLRDLGNLLAPPAPMQGLYQMASYDLPGLAEAEQRLLSAIKKLPK